MIKLPKSEATVFAFIKGYYAGTSEYPDVAEISQGIGISTVSVRAYIRSLGKFQRLDVTPQGRFSFKAPPPQSRIHGPNPFRKYITINN